MKQSNMFFSNKYSVNKEKIDSIIEELNSILKIRCEFLTITIYGGSALCLMSNYRDSTFDIDCRCDKQDILEECISLMDVKSDLINNDIDVFITRREDTMLYKTLSNLEVHLPTLEYLFAMKLKAFRDKDIKDIISIYEELNVNSLEEIEVIFCKYYSRIQFTSTKKQAIQELLDL